MMHEKWGEKADKIMEMQAPLLDKITDNTDDKIPGEAIVACAKLVELAHYLYEIDMMKKKLYPHDDDADNEYEDEKSVSSNPKTRYP